MTLHYLANAARPCDSAQTIRRNEDNAQLRSQVTCKKCNEVMIALETLFPKMANFGNYGYTVDSIFGGFPLVALKVLKAREE